jgi:hypothetical protein
VGIDAKAKTKAGRMWVRVLACGCVREGGGTTAAGGPTVPPPSVRAMCFAGHGMQDVVSSDRGKRVTR